jgi:hypothetical protein
MEAAKAGLDRYAMSMNGIVFDKFAGKYLNVDIPGQKQEAFDTAYGKFNMTPNEFARFPFFVFQDSLALIRFLAALLLAAQTKAWRLAQNHSNRRRIVRRRRPQLDSKPTASSQEKFPSEAFLCILAYASTSARVLRHRRARDCSLGSASTYQRLVESNVMATSLNRCESCAFAPGSQNAGACCRHC